MSHHEDTEASSLDGAPAVEAHRLTRRSFVKAAAAQATALSLAGGLAACGGSSTSTSTKAGGTPKRGGTLRLGMTGGASSDNMNGFVPTSNPSYAIDAQLYDQLVGWDDNAQPSMVLAEEMQPNATATEWTIRIKPGITFHNGKTVTAEDVKYSLQQILSPKLPGVESATLSSMDVAGIKVLDSRTIRVPFKRPFSVLPEALVCYGSPIVPVGYDPRHPIGTGPFKYGSFTPGVQATLIRNENYWMSGLPYVDRLIISDYPDETSQVNALVSGQLDMVSDLTPPSISSIQGAGAKVTIVPSGTFDPVFFRVDVAPFSDVRVRTALKLVVDRPAMRDTVYGGHASIANDVPSPWDEVYSGSSFPQRHQDIEQAKFLLKQAGQENLTFALPVANIEQYNLPMAELYAQQASKAGINIKIQQITVATWSGPNYTKWPASNSFWPYYTYWSMVGQAEVPGAFYGETHLYKANPRFVPLFNEALSTTDSAKRKEIAHEMQAIEYNEGGYVIPVFRADIDANAARVHNVPQPRHGLGYSWRWFNLKGVWLD